MTEPLFRDDAYLKSTPATVVAVNDKGGIIVERSIFYATSGGQAGDSGQVRLPDGQVIQIATTVYEPDRTTIVHVPTAPVDPTAFKPGAPVTLELDWQRRYDLMRVHTCLHLLCSLIDAPVTGGSVDAGKGRLDFDIPEGNPDKQDLTARLNALIEADHPVTSHWITDAELDANPDLVRTMSVQPPRGSGRIRMIEIAGVDLQPCGGTHVRSTGEIGSATVTKIEKKGALNRRIRLELSPVVAP